MSPGSANRRRFRWLGVALAAALAASACGATAEEDFASNPVVAVDDDEGGSAAPATTVAADPACLESDVTRSLAPDAGPLPTPGQMPAGSYMDEIQRRGTLVAGVGADTLLFGYLDPTSGDLEGFDVEMARLVARAIFGDDEDHLVLQPIQSSERIPLLQTPVEEGGVDLVVKTMTINCVRWGSINFSTIYYDSGQRLLVGADSAIVSLDDAVEAGATICAVSGTTSLDNLVAAGATVAEVGEWTDCLVELQQGRVDGISTDDTILAGLGAQDPNAVVVGEPFSSEPYGIGLPQDHPEFTRFVNAVLEQARADGTWNSLYAEWLQPTLGPFEGEPPAVPPAPSYR